jgi:hypothetical protein
LECFQNIIETVELLIQLGGVDELATEFECNEPEDVPENKKKVQAYSSNKYSLVLFMLD